ncbi:MAG: peptidase and chymotrypsin/Hap [Myxococcales bacterium]|nr:peptidase and chymotrypsin/Hap [Myxococcales bacterium]
MKHALVVVLALAGCRERDLATDARTAAPAIGAASTRILYPSAPGSFVDLVAGARHGVVAIRAAAPVKSGPAAMFPGAPEQVADVALGTGFLIESKGVFVVTTDHIATASTELHVVLPDRTEVPAKLVGRDLQLDLALLSVDVPRLQPLPLGSSDDLQVGEWLVVLGDPFGDDITASVGIVSATGREGAGSLAAGRMMGFRTFIQTDARIHRGNSGGPVIDTAGQVVGVAVATSDRLGELSFAIPINRVREIVDALRDYGQVARSWLGVLVMPVTPAQVQALGLLKPSGALVTELKAGSPAARSGLRPGDVILKWGDREVDHRSLPWIVAATPVGKPTNVLVWRNRAGAQLSVVTEKMPE